MNIEPKIKFKIIRNPNYFQIEILLFKEYILKQYY